MTVIIAVTVLLIETTSIPLGGKKHTGHVIWYPEPCFETHGQLQPTLG